MSRLFCLVGLLLTVLNSTVLAIPSQAHGSIRRRSFLSGYPSFPLARPPTPSPQWPDLRYHIAKDVQRSKDMNLGTQSSYRWLLGPTVTTEEQAARYLETCPTLLDCLAIADRERGPPIGPAPFLVFLGLKIELDANLILCVLDAMATPALMEVDERIVRCEEYWTVHFGSQVVAGELSKKGRQYLQNELNKAFRKCTRAGVSKAECERVWTIEVCGETLKPQTKLQFALPDSPTTMKNQAVIGEGLRTHTNLPVTFTNSAKSIKDQAVRSMKDVGDAVRSFNMDDLGRDMLKHGVPALFKVPGVSASVPPLP